MNTFEVKGRAVEGLVESQDAKRIAVTGEQMTLAAARCEALAKVINQANHIKSIKAAHERALAREENYLITLQAAAQEIGAYDVAESIAKVGTEALRCGARS